MGDADHWIDMPLRVVAEHTPSAAPVPWGDGFLCVDLGPDDEETWSTFSEVVAAEPDFEAVARRAQVWRLPVTPYRRRPTSAFESAVPEHDPVDLRGVTIIDMTAMWAGPLCTELLARAGARVVKIEPAARLDGLRFGDGDDGSGCSPMFRALNASKEIVDLDLRHCSDSDEFRRLVRHADAIVTSLSPRAIENLSLTPDDLRVDNPKLKSLSLTAFPAESAEANWVAYGTGVHAMSGLGFVDDRPIAPAFSYPDPLAGLLGCRMLLGQLAGVLAPQERVSLAQAVAPLTQLVP